MVNFHARKGGKKQVNVGMFFLFIITVLQNIFNCLRHLPENYKCKKCKTVILSTKTTFHIPECNILL